MAVQAGAVAQLRGDRLRVRPVHARRGKGRHRLFQALPGHAERLLGQPGELLHQTGQADEDPRRQRPVRAGQGVVTAGDVAELADQPAHHPGRVAEGVRVQRGRQVQVRVRRRRPAHGRTVRVAGKRHRQVLPVAVVAPTGVEHAGSAVAHRALTGAADVGQRGGRVADDGAPAVDPRREVERQPRLHAGLGVGVERGVRRVVFHDRDRAGGELGGQLRMVDEHVAPELRGAPAPAHQLVHLPDVVQVDRSRAALFDDAARPRQADARLVTADVHLTAREVREQFLQQLVDQRDRAGIGGTQGAVQAAVRVEDRRIVVLAQRAVARMDHPARQVPEGVLVRHQFHIAIAAVGVELHHLLAGHRRPVGPHLSVVAVGEGVLGIELELVDLPFAEQVDQAEQGLHGRYPVAADVQHDAAVDDVGVIRDPDAGEDAVPRLARDLPERHRPVEGARLVMADDLDAFASDGQQIALRPAHPSRIDRHRGADLRS